MHIRLAIHPILLLFILLSTDLFNFSHASDFVKEHRWKEQVADYVMNGESVFLNTGTYEFLSIYMDAYEQPAKGSIIILHSRGLHPNWPVLIYPLRTTLPEKGWNTLTIQLPVLNSEATFYNYLKILSEAHPRIDAAIHFLKQKGEDNIVLLAHGCGVHMAFDWLHQHQGAGINAYIGIGMSSVDRGQPMLKPFALEDIKIPVLDIYGEYDYYSVQVNGPRRLARIKQAGHPKSKQRMVEKANHYFIDKNEVLLTTV